MSGSLAAAGGTRIRGTQAWALLWRSSRMLGVLVAAWVVLTALGPAAVVVALGVAVGRVPDAISAGLASPAGARLWESLAVAAVVYAVTLVLDPVGNALGTAAKTRITGAMQRRLLAAVSAPVGTAHLEDPVVLDRLARAEGSLTGYFPGDAPVTWAGILASRVGGIVGCVLVSLQVWWLGIVLLAVWLFVRRLVLRSVVAQATQLRGQASAMRYAWYLVGVGTKVRDAKEVRVFGLADFVAGRFGTEHRAAMDNASGGLRSLHRRVALGFLVVLAAYALALGVIVESAAGGALPVAQLVILLPMLAVTAQAGSISFDDITLTWALSAVPDVTTLERELVATPPGAATSPQGTEPLGDRPRHALRFEGVRFAYPAGSHPEAGSPEADYPAANSPAAAREVLRGLDLELAAGRATAIVGVNGAGKSTLVSLLARMNEPTAGAITADGTDIRRIDPVSWQRAVALMPQNFTRFPLSARENLVFGAIEHAGDEAGVAEAARLAGFDTVVAELPDGWDTVLSRQLPGGVELSGGQWQRLALARSLFAARHGARILVLDEPTAALDVASEARFYDRFLEITAGMTTVVISHRFATVKRADVIAVLDGGVITERGSHDELVAAGGTYAEMYRVQAQRFRGAAAGAGGTTSAARGGAAAGTDGRRRPGASGTPRGDAR